MIEKFFTQQKTLFRMGEGILGPYLPAIAKVLDEALYSTATIRRHLRAADHFGTWLQENNIAVAPIPTASCPSQRWMGPRVLPAL